MSSSEQLEVDYLREKFPRAYKALVQLYPFEWDRMLRAADGAVEQGKTASIIVGKFSILRGLEKSTRRWLVLCFAADRREIVVRKQRSFLTRLHDRSLEDILAELRALEERFQSNAPGGVPTPPNDGLTRGFTFISHHTKTQNKFALTLAEGLESRGFPCWVAPRNVRDGSSWNEEIYGASQRCGSLVLLCSAESARSKVVQGEVHIAVGRGVPVIVVKFGNVEPAKINVGLAAYQHLDWCDLGIDPVGALIQRISIALTGVPRNAA